MTDFATYAVLAAALIVIILQSIKLWRNEKLLSGYRDACEATIEAFTAIADGRAEVRRTGDGAVRVFFKD